MNEQVVGRRTARPAPGMGDSYVCIDLWDEWIPVHDEPLIGGEIPFSGGRTFSPPPTLLPYWVPAPAAVPARCAWCGDFHSHTGMCPKVQEIEYHENGTVKRVVMR